MTKIYTYQKCSTCRKATQWLDSNDIAFEEHPIRETPPSKKELDTMLDAYNGEIRRLFNSSGMDYRAMNLKDKLPSLSKTEAFKLLTQNGNLVKRPFLLSTGFNTVGFKEAAWTEGLI